MKATKLVLERLKAERKQSDRALQQANDVITQAEARRLQVLSMQNELDLAITELEIIAESPELDSVLANARKEK